MIVLSLVVLAGLLIIGCAVENWRDVIGRHVTDAAERQSHDRLMREIRRLP